MNRRELINQIKEKRSFLCVGLDSDIKKLPAHLQNSEDAVFALRTSFFPAWAQPLLRPARIKTTSAL